MKNKRFIGLLVAALGVILIILYPRFTYNKYKGQTTFINGENSIIKRVDIKICQQNFAFQNIKPGGERSFNFHVIGDSHYEITIAFMSQNHYTKELGYVTRGFNYKHKLIAKAGQILIERGM